MKQVGGSFLFCMLAFSRLVGAQPSCVPGFKKRFATLTQNDQNKKDTAYLNDGWGFSTKGNYKKADEYYQQALTLAEKIILITCWQKYFIIWAQAPWRRVMIH